MMRVGVTTLGRIIRDSDTKEMTFDCKDEQEPAVQQS